MGTQTTLLTMPIAQVNGITIAYEERGDGPPLLLVMGLGGQLTDWPPSFVDALAERFRVVVFDNRDSGLSSQIEGPTPGLWATLRAVLFRRKPEAAYRVADMAADSAGLLDHLGIGAAHVAGVSMGGMIAQQLTIDHPKRVRSLTSIMSTTGDPKVGRPRSSLVARMAVRRPPEPGSPVEEIVEQGMWLYRLISGPARDEAAARELIRRSIARSYRPEGTARQLAAIQASPDRTEALGRIGVPTVVVHGLVDPLVRFSGGQATAKAVPGSRLLAFPDMAHDLPSTRTEELAEAMARNAARVEPVPGIPAP